MGKSSPGAKEGTSTGIVKDTRYMDHWMGDYHPECPQRLKVIYDMLEEPGMAGKFQKIPPRFADKKELLLVHAGYYIDTLAATSGIEYTYLDPDTQTCAASYDAAVLAAGGLCEAISKVCAGELKNAFALVRPPGHHAEKAQAKGFCLFNNVAVGARYAQESLGIGRVLIVDWDLHHGNGTQHSFEEDPTILYFSTHQFPYYPGTGAYSEIGTGKGRGFTINVPLTIGYGDAEYLSIFHRILKPIAMEYQPELILVSAGFDIYIGDPLGGMNVTPQGFAAMTRSIMDIADQCCGGKLVLTLEGGYDLDGERDSVREVLKEMAGLNKVNLADLMGSVMQEMVDSVVTRVKNVHGQYWKSL
jgi:acetoin utilization deacetylase AcuC-like enzyme